MKEFILYLSQLPAFILIIALLVEMGLIVLFFQFLMEEGYEPKKRKIGGVVAQFNSDEHKAVFKIIEKRLNELTSICDMHEKRLGQLETQSGRTENHAGGGLENKVNELQKMVFSIVEKIKEYK